MPEDSPRTDEVPRCPSCGSEKVRRYAYGYIVFKNEQQKQKFDREFVMGGCIVADDLPRFHCDTCGADYR